MKLKLCVLPAQTHGLEPSVADRFRHMPSAESDREGGLIVEMVSKATVWQTKARLMEVTGIAPVGCHLSGTPTCAKTFADTEALYDLGLSTVSPFSGSAADERGEMLYIYYSSKAGDGKGKKASLPTKAAAPTPLKKYYATKKRGVPFADLSFAAGRGLRQAVLNMESEFDLYATDKSGLLISTEHLNFEVVFEMFDESGLQFIEFEKQLTHDKDTRACHVRFKAPRPGNYLLTIKLKEAAAAAAEFQSIAGSPFELAVIDVDNRAEVRINELSLQENWSLEMSAVLRDFSKEPEAHRRIFDEIGVRTILQMTRFKDQRIQENVATCLENLLKIDQNKVRMVSEGSIELVRKLADLSSRVDRPELLRFMGKLLALLMEQDTLRGEVVTLLGTGPIQYLLQVSDLNCHLSALRALMLMSADDVHRETVLGSGLVGALWGLVVKGGDDVYLQRLVLRVLANLSDCVERFDVDARGFDKIVEKIGSTDSMVNVRAVHILANLTLKPEYAAKCLAALKNICNVVTAAQIRFEWEYASMQALLTAQGQHEAEKPVIGDTTYELNFYFMRILANLLQQKSEESKQAIFQNKVLAILVHFARSYDVIVKNEACRALAHFCDQNSWLNEVVKAAGSAGDKMAPLITLVSSGVLSPEGQVCVVAKMQELLDTTKGKAQALITNVDEQGQDVLLDLLRHPDPTVQRNASIVLAGIVKNEQYKSRIVRRGGPMFLNNLMLLVKEGVVEVQRSVDAGEIEWDEIIGKGVSGIVWAAKWQGAVAPTAGMAQRTTAKPVCAVKKFKEENIAFDEEEFKSELAMMSVLRHPNIVHSLGGCTRRDNLFIISPLYRKGSLADVILHKTFKIDRGMGIQMLLDVAAGMQYLHSLNILHRDLKAGNCLISDDWAVCVTDFGVSKMMTQEMSKAAGTPMYMSPEILNGKPYSLAADTYSYAFIVWELVARTLPYGEMQPWEITREVCDNNLRPTKLNDPFDLLAEHCWDKAAEKRPTFTQISEYLSVLRADFRTGGEEAFARSAVASVKWLVEPPATSGGSMPLSARRASVNTRKLEQRLGSESRPVLDMDRALDKVTTGGASSAALLSPSSTGSSNGASGAAASPSTSSPNVLPPTQKSVFNILSMRSKQRKSDTNTTLNDL